ncbi:MAG: 2Fe-2S iron-sulfur cluster-binding protein [Pseudomonadota bacterium]|nr:2Fe-2S iron-sulfur cluster-binding protein [Pseudomonadota bacterium]
MTKILFLEHNGTEHLIDAPNGPSLMQVAVDNMVPGIVGDCGGCCSCATCHCYLDEQWAGRVSTKNADEETMLDGALEVRPNSRLSCQLRVSAELDGLVLHLPESQF